MVCLIIMDAGTPETHPVPNGWVIKDKIADILPEITDEILLYQLQEIHDTDLGRHDLFSRDLSVQVFLLVS